MAVPRSAGHVIGQCRSWLRGPVLALDRRLRRRGGIVEYSSRSDCLLRMQIAWLDRELRLSDGARAGPGDRMIMLHMWNEHVPPYGGDGATFAWARRFASAMDVSLCELSRHLSARPELDDICLIGMAMNIATARNNAQLLRIVARFGFEAVPQPPERRLRMALHRLGDNIWGSILILSHNPAALRIGNFWRTPLQVFVSREMLRLRYG